MSQDQERMKALLALKQRLEKRVEKLETETKELKMSLEAVNMILLEKGFNLGFHKPASRDEIHER